MTNTRKRLETIDTIRGITIISMILYHLCWDLKYLKGFSMPWYGTFGTYLWQQSICWCFIIISGFCLHFAKEPIRNGFIVFLCGFIVSCVTIIFVPEAPVYFGVLTLLGSSMILAGAFWRLYRSGRLWAIKPIDPFWGFVIFSFLFAITRQINSGFLNFGFFKVDLPSEWYGLGVHDGLANMHLTYLGFMQEGFYSSDYFSLMPWFFLFMVGYNLYVILEKHFDKPAFDVKIIPFSWLGKHSLIIYLLHQPVLYGITMLIR